MPDGLQQGPTGELLQERANAMSSAADELEDIDLEDWVKDGERKNDDGDPVNEEGQTEAEYWDGRLSDIQNVNIDVP